MQPKGVQPEGEKSKLKISPSLDRVKKQGQNNNEVEIFSKKPIFHYKNDFSHKK
jgi:hypothetical protein